MRNTVIFYNEWYETIKELSDEERLKVYDAIMQFAFEEVEPTDRFVKAATALIFKGIKRTWAQYDEKCERNRQNVMARWRKRIEAADATTANDSIRSNTTATNNDSNYDNENDNDNEPTIVGDKEKEKTSNEVKKKVASTQVRRFVKPTPSEVQAYCDERGNGISGEAFCNFYESKGWLIGKSPMKDWKAAVRTWEAKDGRSKPKNAKGQQLGAGEWIENGVRYYGSGHQVPMSAPPRPSESSYWSGESNSWVSGV